MKVFLTLPVTTASAESNLSKLKIIKNYLRTTMGQERLSNLSLISIESELLELIPQKDIIQKFAAAKARQVIFDWNWKHEEEFQIKYTFFLHLDISLFLYAFISIQMVKCNCLLRCLKSINISALRIFNCYFYL